MLKVKQNKIYEIIGDDEREVRLYGVNRAGLEWESRDGQILDSIKYACDEWHANIIRLPVSQDRWFGRMPEQNDENNAEKYRARVDEIIDAVAERGKYLLLDLHWSDLGLWNGKSGQHMMPDEHSLLFWQNAAARYRNHPNVLFGLYNEPHIDKKVDGEFGDPWHIWKFGGELREKDTSYRAVGMQEMIDKVRSTGAKNVVVVGGLDWGYTLDGAVGENAISDPDGNGIILDSHVYPWKRLEWELDIGGLDRDFPILVGEFGHYGNDAKPVEGVQRLPSEEWMPRLLGWIEKNGYSFTAWDFHPKAGPCLIKSFNNEPTEYHGIYVKEFLLDHNK